MIRLYNSDKYFKANEIIIDNESFFKNNISAKRLSETSIEIMKRIDKANLLDRKTGKIETPYGITSISDLSTGCKTVLNSIFIIENPDRYPTVKAIKATECGWNALEELFQFFETNNIETLAIIIEHDNFLYKCKDRNYLLNDDEKITSMVDFFLPFKEVQYETML